ncbi:MAG: phosphoribosylformylglycinamidine cyclo-ligase, partial [Candidatus Diapherotrites archaeon]|nr:phosphoribosylformylglycinamidine cyclo-ligase [Candidatus Diapherotrites archaeon]
LGMTVGEAILSPTRTNAPIIFEILKKARKHVTGMCHNTGGGQTKINHLGKNIHYVKDNLFEMPPLFKLIQRISKEEWKNMYPTFNCGSRLDIVCKPEAKDTIIQIAKNYGVEAKQIGYCKPSPDGNKTTVQSQYGTFEYKK